MTTFCSVKLAKEAQLYQLVMCYPGLVLMMKEANQFATEHLVARNIQDDQDMMVAIACIHLTLSTEAAHVLARHTCTVMIAGRGLDLNSMAG